MTLKEFITGSVKIVGLVILLYGVLNTANALLGAGGTYYSYRVTHNMSPASSDASYEMELRKIACVSELKARGDMQLMRIPLALI